MEEDDPRGTQVRERLRHPEFGRMELDYLKLTDTDDQQAVIVFQAADAGSAARLARIQASAPPLIGIETSGGASSAS